MKIIGLSGTNGAGKDSFGEILQKYHDWLFISVTDILRHGLNELDLPIERDNLRNLSADWRRKDGLGILVDKAVQEFEAKGGSKKYKGLAIASLRHPGEADRVHELGGQVVWVNADSKLRYERITNRMRGDEDKKTYEQFLADEQVELKHAGDEATLSLSAVKARADIFLENNSTLEDFRQTIEAALKLEK